MGGGPEGDGAGVRQLGQALLAAGRGLSAAADALSSQVRLLVPAGWSGDSANEFSSDWNSKAAQAGRLAAACQHAGQVLVDLGNAIDAANQQAANAQQMTGGPASRFALPATEQKSQQLQAQASGDAQQARAAARAKLAGIAVPRIGPRLTASAVKAWATHLAPPAPHRRGGLLGDIGSFFAGTVHDGAHLRGDAGHLLGDAGHVAGDIAAGAGQFAEGFLWDGAVGTLKGLGDLVGIGPLWGDPSFLQTWKGIELLAQPIVMPGDVTPESMAAWEGFGKSLLAWDEWKKDPGRAAGNVVFNVVTAPFVASKVLEAGTAAKAAADAGEAGTAAADAGKAADVGRAAADSAEAAKTADSAEAAKAAADAAAALREQHANAAEDVLRAEQTQQREELLLERDRRLEEAPPTERLRIIREYADSRQKLIQQQELDRAALRVLALCSEWDPDKGGVVAVNRNLCEGLAEAGHEVFVRVGHEAPADVGNPRLHVIGPREYDPAKDPRDQLAYEGEDLPPEVDVVIGHSRFSGPAAALMRDELYPDAKLAHMVHMVTGALGRVKGEAAKGLVNEEIERSLVARSDVAVGVGPTLAEEVQRLVAMSGSERDPVVHELIPGVPFEEPAPPPAGRAPSILLFGRTDDMNKGAREAALMVRELRLQGDVRLTVRGARPETVARAKQLLSNLAGREVDVRPYTVDRAEILADMRQADLVIMPSRAEGFGLVALEAAGAGVPILVPSSSGVGRFLGDAGRFPAEIAGQIAVEQGFEDPVPVGRWVEKLQGVLDDLPAARQRALKLRSVLREQNRTWKGAAESLAAVIRAASKR